MRDLLAGTSLTPWIPPQAPTVTMTSTAEVPPVNPQDLVDSLMLNFSSNPAWRAARYVMDAFPGRLLDLDYVREIAVYFEER